MLVIKVGGPGMYTGNRIARSVEKVNALKYRVVLANGKKIFVESVDVIKVVEAKNEKDS